MVDQQTIGTFLYDVLQSRSQQGPAPDITALRGTLRCLDTSDLREETGSLSDLPC